jgi:hypothetical protein
MKALVVLTGMFLLSASIVWAQPAPVAKTGQTTSYRAGDDGALEKGAVSPSPRFTDNGDGTVTDNLTGLMWAKDASSPIGLTWNNAIDYANNLSLGTSCGTPRTDWRLPNVKELQSLIDFSNYSLALPTGYPFTSVQHGYNWTSTTFALDTSFAWVVDMSTGDMDDIKKSGIYPVWPVRSDN